MKSFLFLASVVAFYLGVNYLSFSEGAIERWINKTQFPAIENAEIFCEMLTPETKIEFSYTINDGRKKSVAASSDELCNYFKQRTIPGVKRNTAWITPKIKSHQRIESIPFNQAKSSIDLSIRSKPYQTTRQLDIELKRGFLGDFKIISIKGHDQITQEIKPRTRR